MVDWTAFDVLTGTLASSTIGYGILQIVGILKEVIFRGKPQLRFNHLKLTNFHRNIFASLKNSHHSAFLLSVYLGIVTLSARGIPKVVDHFKLPIRKEIMFLLIGAIGGLFLAILSIFRFSPFKLHFFQSFLLCLVFFFLVQHSYT